MRPYPPGGTATLDAPQPEVLALNEQSRIRAAAFRALNLYPGPVGELVNQELLAWESFGYRVGSHGLVNRLVDHVLKASP